MLDAGANKHCITRLKRMAPLAVDEYASTLRDDVHFVLIVGLISAVAIGYAAWLGSKIQHGDGAASPVAAETEAGCGDGGAGLYCSSARSAV